MRQTAGIATAIDHAAIERLAEALHEVYRHQGRVFVVGLGGSLANAEHMAADLRKLCEIEAQAPNPAEMSAWINDVSRDHVFDGALRWMRADDVLLVLSVGGGASDVSAGITRAVAEFKSVSQKVFGIVGPIGGYTAEHADIVIKVPAIDRITPHTEAFQAVIWHCLVSHPLLQKHKTKW